MLVVLAGTRSGAILVIVLTTQLVDASAARLTDGAGQYLKIV